MAARPIRQVRPGWAHWSAPPACNDRHAQGALALALADSAAARQALAAPAANARKVAAESFQMVTQKIVEAQALDTRPQTICAPSPRRSTCRWICCTRPRR